ncbi:hypothetical protein P4S72_06970 [Vibrio sp. PP-XX7]
MGDLHSPFWLGLLLIQFVAMPFGIFSVSGFNQPSDIVLPAFTLGASVAAVMARFTRSGILRSRTGRLCSDRKIERTKSPADYPEAYYAERFDSSDHHVGVAVRLSVGGLNCC